MELNREPACTLGKAIRKGDISACEVVDACLEQIREREPAIHAFAFLNEELAMRQAREADARRVAGEPLGPLHGIPVGVKDVFDTFDQPTQYGSVFYRNYQPSADAFVVSLLRQAGAILLGKTTTTELATPCPGPARNPHDLTRTPGGSSSGSGAAVADHMLPLAIGTQTKASVLRPAAYCGVIGYKPTHGLISRTGIVHQSYLLDQVGGIARTVVDVALLNQCMISYDPRDPDMRPVALPNLVAAAEQPFDRPPRLLFVKGEPWKLVRPGVAEIFTAFLELLRKVPGSVIDEKPMPESIAHALIWIDNVLSSELAHNFGHLYRRDRNMLSPQLRILIEDGMKTTVMDYLEGMEEAPRVTSRIHEFMRGYDAIITLAATGEADENPQETSGNSILCAIWNYAGLPSISLPLLKGPNRLPLGVQLIAPKGQDCRLMSIAAWFNERFPVEMNP